MRVRARYAVDCSTLRGGREVAASDLRGGCEVGVLALRGLHRTQRFNIEQPNDLRRIATHIAIERQLVTEALTITARMRQQMLKLYEPIGVDTHSRFAQTREGADFSARDAHETVLNRLLCCTLSNELLHLTQQTPRLRRQLIQRTAEHFMREAIGQRNVVQRDLDVGNLFASVSRVTDRLWQRLVGVAPPA